jgi:hypothetical protein
MLQKAQVSTPTTLRQATARLVIVIWFDELEKLWRKIWSLRGDREIVHHLLRT